MTPTASERVLDEATLATRAIEPDLERLSRAVSSAEPSDRVSLTELQAAATRAGESLTDARRELRDLAAGDDLDAAARRSLTTRVAAIRDLQELADVLGAVRLSSPRIEAASARAALATDDLPGTDLPEIKADALTHGLREFRNAAERRSRQRAAERARRARDAARTGQPSAPVGSSSDAGQPTYVEYTGPAFRARIPTGSGWGTPSSSEPTPGQLFRTNLRGPGGLFVIIDYTPFELARFGGSYTARTVVGQTAFGAAVRYEFQGGRIAECQRAPCVDYIINDRASGRGFAVLAGGGSGAAELARTVAESVVPK